MKKEGGNFEYNREDTMVVNVVGQREFQSPVVDGRNIRLDILAKDSVGKHYNIEVQKKPEGAHIRRARFNSSMMDSRMLKTGQDFSELQDSYMVFITQTDIFGHGIPIYTINRHFEEIDDWFEDGSHIIYVNAATRGMMQWGSCCMILDVVSQRICFILNWRMECGILRRKEDEEV